MTTTGTLFLDLPSLPSQARIAHRLPGITNNLISAPVLCDAGCTVSFNNKNVEVIKDGKTVLEGVRDRDNGLWRVPIAQAPNLTTTAAMTQPKEVLDPIVANLYNCNSEKELTRFYHATCFSPRKST